MITKPRIRYSQLSKANDVYRTLVQLDIPLPQRAVAIVLDMSDSNTHVREASTQLPKLLAKVDRDLPLYILRLSLREILNEKSNDTVGHLVDESISLLNWLDDRTGVEFAARCGSFLRPTMECLNELCLDDGVQELLTVVITDGELSDREAIAIKPSIQLVGLAPSRGDYNRERWARVTEKRPFIGLEKGFLDLSNFQFMNSSAPSLDVEIGRVGDQAIKVEYHHAESNEMMGFSKKVWDFCNPLSLILTSQEPVSPKTIFQLVSSDPLLKYQFFFSDAVELPHHKAIPFQKYDSVSKQSTSTSCVIDTKESGGNIEHLRRIIDEIELLTSNREKWDTTENQRSLLFTFLLNALPQLESSDGLICFVNEPSSEEMLRLVAFPLCRSISTAIEWSPSTSTVCGVPAKSIKVSYHRMEGRWQCLVEGEEVVELDPNGSQFLGELFFDSKPWKFYSSGPCNFQSQRGYEQ